jgi:hypothetical protein
VTFSKVKLRLSMVVLLLLCLQQIWGGQVFADTPGSEVTLYSDYHWLIGVGYGIVKFDSKVKVTDKDSGRPRFVDLEGTLGLPEETSIPTLYGAYRFNHKHSLLFGYFAIDRKSTLIDFDKNFDDIILIKARVTIEDTSRFYNVSYGYNLFRDDRSHVTFVAGLNILDLRIGAEASGQITVDGDTREQVEIADARVLAPLPLLGLNFGFSFTPDWSIGTRIALIGGSYQDVSASVVQTTINSRYQFSRHTGLLLGLTYFDADVDINDDDEFTEISYAYTGAFIGLHIGF